MGKIIRLARNAITLSLLVSFSAPLGIWADSGPAHRFDQLFPVQLGTSGGNINDSTRKFCFGGTLGALVEDAQGQYILSNNHVLARTNLAAIGEDIIQPGLIDQVPACAKDPTDIVADLSSFVRLLFKKIGKIPINSVDAAIAKIRNGAVDPSGSILDIGPISSDTLPPTLGLAVKKSGRTSGLTTGMISALHVTVDVSYGKRKTARFTDQIIITPGSFLMSGDSGSLMVEDVDPTPHAVGLLFAGGSTIAIANPIGPVLDAFGVTMVGSTPSAGAFGKIFSWAKNLLGVAVSHAATPQSPGRVDPVVIDAVKRVKQRHENRLLAIPEVVGLGVGHSEKVPGRAALEIYVKRHTESLRLALPNSLDGVEVKVVETGEIVAY